MARSGDCMGGFALSGYDKALLNGLKPTDGQQKQHRKAISEALKDVLAGELPGEGCSVAEMLVVRSVGEAIANPSSKKLKEIASIVGDDGPVKVSIEGRAPLPADFLDCEIKGDGDGAGD